MVAFAGRNARASIQKLESLIPGDDDGFYYKVVFVF